MATPRVPHDIFVSFEESAPEDVALLKDLADHLTGAELGSAVWHRGHITAGGDVEQEVAEHFSRARLILVLVSASYLASDSCVEEVERALARHQRGDARVIPIILRDCQWKRQPLAQLKVLPTNKIPVNQWRDRDAALTDVVDGVLEAYEQLSSALNEQKSAPLLSVTLPTGGVAGSPDHQNQLNALTTRTQLQASTVDPMPPTIDAYDVELDRAKSLIHRHQYEAAEFVVCELQSRSYDRLTPLQRFRCLTYLGLVEFRKDNREKGASLFIEAAKVYPEHERAAINRAEAECILGHQEEAWAIAKEAFSAKPHFAPAASVYVECAPPTISTDTILSTVSEEIKRSPEFVSAIAQRYMMEERFEDAIAWARRIDRRSKYGPNALRIVGLALIESSTPPDPRDSAYVPVAANRLKEAIDVLEAAAVDAKAQGDYVLALESRYSQLDAARILGDTERAESIIDEGLRLSEKYPVALGQFLLARSQFYTQRGDAKRAFRDAEKAIALVSSPTAHAIFAVCLWNRNEGSDRVMARREMARLLDIVTGYLLEQCTGILLRGCIFDGLFSEAQDVLLVAERRGLDSAAISAYRAQIAHAKSGIEDARQLALAAAQQIGEGTSRSTRQLVAEVLVTVGLQSEVVPILETLASRSELTVDTRNLVRAAFHAERHQLVLEWCESLRQADVWDDELLKVELSLLERYDALKAIEVIETALLRMPDNRALKVRRCSVGIRLQRSDLVKLTPGDVPPSSEVDLDHLPATVECLMYNSFYREAIDYAYCCVHRFPNEPEAHMAFIRCFLFLPGEQLSLANPVEVCIGSAVEYQEDGCDRSVWRVIEHELPLSFPDMVESSARIAKALLGHRVGDKIVLAGGMARDRAATILQIRNKYVHRWNDSMASWQLKFSDVPFLEQIKMDTDPHTGDIDISPIFKMLKAIGDRVEHIDGVYRSGVVSMYLMANELNRSVFETMEHLAFDNEVFINCAFVTDESFAAAVERLKQARGLVLDSTALWTLHALNLVDVLERLQMPIVVVPSTLEEMRDSTEESSGANRGGRAQQMLMMVGKRLGIVKHAAETRQAEDERWKSTAAMLKRRCQLGTAISLSKLEPAQRKDLMRFVGEHGSQAMAAAKDAGYLLWTDDRVQEFFAKNIFDVDRVWTQVVLAWLQQSKIVSDQEFLQASALLQALRYTGSKIGADLVIEAGRLSEWHAGSLMLQRNLRVLEDNHVAPGVCLEIALQFTLAVSREVRVPLSRHNLLISMLERLRRHTDGRRIIQELVRRLPTTMELDPIRAQQTKSTIEAWLLADRQRLIPGTARRR